MNEQRPLNEDFRNKLQNFFTYKWKHDRNSAIDDEEELAQLDQIADDTQDSIYASFLFRDFLSTFFYYFRVQCNFSLLGTPYYLKSLSNLLQEE